MRRLSTATLFGALLVIAFGTIAVAAEAPAEPTGVTEGSMCDFPLSVGGSAVVTITLTYHPDGRVTRESVAVDCLRDDTIPTIPATVDRILPGYIDRSDGESVKSGDGGARSVDGDRIVVD